MCNTGIGTTDLQFKVDWKDGNRRLAWITADDKVEIVPDLTLEEARQAMADMMVTLAGLVLCEQDALSVVRNNNVKGYLDEVHP